MDFLNGPTQPTPSRNLTVRASSQQVGLLSQALPSHSTAAEPSGGRAERKAKHMFV